MTELHQLAEVWERHLPKAGTLGYHERVFFPRLVELARQSKTILEVGAGRGRMVSLLRENGAKGTIICLDINRYVNECDGEPCICDARALPFRDNTFELVYSLGVVEHFEGTERAIAEHARVVRNGGHVLITTPRLSVYTPLRWAVWFIKYRHLGSFQQVMGRNLSIASVRGAMEKSGVLVTRAGSSGFFLPKASKHLWVVLKWVLPESIFGAYLWCLGEKL